MNGSISPPSNPSIVNLKKQAKRLQRLWKKRDADTAARIRVSLLKHTDASDEQIWGAKALLTDCQLVIAREAGFESWKTLKAAVELGSVVIEDPNFVDLFMDRDVDGAKALLHRHSELAQHSDYKIHPLLRECLQLNRGSCYRYEHQIIADLLIPEQVRAFRDAVLRDRVEDVREQLRLDPDLVNAEFTTNHGLTRAIAQFHSQEMGQLLLDAGAEVNYLTKHLYHGNVEGVRLLLENGADPNQEGGIKYMPSHAMPVLVPLLLDYGWDINEGNGQRTLMHHDANHGHGEKVRVLLDNGADPNVTDGRRRTVLHLFAAKGIGASAIGALVKAGADISARDNEGNTPLGLARMGKRQTAARVLIELGAEE